MRLPVIALWVGALGVMGCSEGAQSSVLGINEFQITESPEQLKVVGLDAHKAVVGQVTLTLGEFVSVEDGQPFTGRQMEVDVEGTKSTHQSSRLDDGTLPDVKLPLYPGDDRTAFNAFLLDSHVSSALAQRGVQFQPLGTMSKQPASEEAYAACAPFPTAACGASDPCCEGADGNPGENMQYACCNITDQGLSRTCNGMPKPGTSSCGANGTNGCSVCWFNPYVGGTCHLKAACAGITAEWE